MLLEQELIEEVVKAAVNAALYADPESRVFFFQDQQLLAAIARQSRPADQIRADVTMLNGIGILSNDDCPLRKWLSVAQERTFDEVSKRVFARAVVNTFARPAEGTRKTVYVIGAAFQEGPITDRPNADARPLETLDMICLEAVLALLDRPEEGLREEVRGKIKQVHFGTMGCRPFERHRTADGQVINSLWKKARLQLRRSDWDVGSYNTHIGTSDSGALALLRAVTAMRADGGPDTVLVVAGEQMYPASDRRLSFMPSDDVESLSGEQVKAVERKVDRELIQQWVNSVVDQDEAATFGVSMPQLADLLADQAIWRSGLSETNWRRLLGASTLDKYQFAEHYPVSFQVGWEARRQVVVGRDYYDQSRNPMITQHFSRHDLCANANGATALLLTTDRAFAERWSRSCGLQSGLVVLRGMGSGSVEANFSGRAGPTDRFTSIRRALRRLVEQASVDPELFVRYRGTSGIFHDAFPVIELAFLMELYQYRMRRAKRRGERVPREGLWTWVFTRFLRAWSNPLGGLCAGGHALGNSGLFQVAKAFHILAEDPRYLTGGGGWEAEARARYEEVLKPNHLLVTSVGSALTHVIATLVARDEHASDLRVDDPDAVAEVLKDFGSDPHDSLLTSGMLGKLSARNRAVIMAGTRSATHGRWVYLAYCYDGRTGKGRSTLLLGASLDEARLDNGTLVQTRVNAPEVDRVVEAKMIPPPAMIEADLRTILGTIEEVEGRLARRLRTPAGTQA
ncbi:MAG: hypothetical protein KC549_12325 [Myxococcales bacterium]|nr:hypothetical protein [Myxococcales bacterium]